MDTQTVLIKVQQNFFLVYSPERERARARARASERKFIRNDTHNGEPLSLLSLSLSHII
jgi:hypothetical protein